jgi:Zn-dependent protease
MFIKIFIILLKLLQQKMKYSPLKLSNLSDPFQKYPIAFKAAEDILSTQGFSFLHTLQKTNPHTWKDDILQLYSNTEKNSFARVTPRNLPIYPFPFQITYETYFANGFTANTCDGMKGLLLESSQSNIYSDGFLGDPHQQWNLHQQSVERIKKEANTTPINLTLEEYITQSKKIFALDLVLWEKNYFAKKKYDYYTYSLSGVWIIIVSINKTNSLRAKLLKTASAVPLSNQDANIEADINFIENTFIQDELKAKATSTRLIITLITALLFLITFGLLFSWQAACIILGVLFFHELGHWVGMKLFKYRAPSIFFIPFLGAVTTGEKEDATPYQKLIILLLGPLPGIIIGTIIMITSAFNNDSFYHMIGLYSVILNYINLLPVAPLDGGKIVDIFIRHRAPFGSVLFTAFSAIVLCFSTIALGEPLLGILAVLMIFNVQSTWQMYKSIKALKEKQITNQDRDSLLRTIVSFTYQSPSILKKSSRRFTTIKSLYSYFISPVPSRAQSIVGGITYAAVLFSPFFITILSLVISLSLALMWRFQNAPTENYFKDKLVNASSTKERYEIFYQLGEFYQHNHESPDSASKYYHHALACADTLNLKDDSYVATLQALAKIDTDSLRSNRYYARALSVAEQLHDSLHPKIADVLMQYSTFRYSELTDTQKICNLQRVVGIYKASREKEEESNAEHALSQLYEKSGQYALAESCLVHSMHPSVQKDTLYTQSFRVQLIADFYQRTHRDSLAQSLLDTWENRYSAMTSYHYFFNKMNLSSHCGWIALVRKDTARARRAFGTALEVVQKYNEKGHFKYYELHCMLDLCYLNILTGNINTARHDFQQMKEKHKSDEWKRWISDIKSDTKNKQNSYTDWESYRQQAHAEVIDTLEKLQ